MKGFYLEANRSILLILRAPPCNKRKWKYLRSGTASFSAKAWKLAQSAHLGTTWLVQEKWRTYSLLDMVACCRKSEDFGQLCCFPSGTLEQPFYQKLNFSYCVSFPLCLRRMRHWDLLFGIKYFPYVSTLFHSSNAIHRPCCSCWGNVTSKYGSSFLERITFFFLHREASDRDGSFIPVVLQERESAVMGVIAKKCIFLDLNSYNPWSRSPLLPMW